MSQTMKPEWLALEFLSVLEVKGEDAATFLQGQLSSDIRQLNAHRCQLSSYSSPKGRMFATFMVYQTDAQTFYLCVARDLSEFILKRLSMFIMRSKVTARIADEWMILGSLSREALEASLNKPIEDWQFYSIDSRHYLTLPNQRMMLLIQADQQAEYSILKDSQAWILEDIRSAIPWVTEKTKELFVPQMCNLELIGDGVSFKKGCYPGQEIVARSQYIGQVKRRMFPAHIHLPVEVGTPLYSSTSGGQIIGYVLTSVTDGTHSDVLAVVQVSKIEEGIYVKDHSDVLFEFSEPPYEFIDVTAN